MVKQALQNPGILSCHPSGGDDYAALQADLNRGGACRWYGQYHTSKPLNVTSNTTSIEGVDATMTTIICHSSWDAATDHQLIRNWVDADWTVGETNHRLAPTDLNHSGTHSLNFYPRIQNLGLNGNGNANLSLLAWSCPNERGYFRNLILASGIFTNTDSKVIGVDIQESPSTVGASLNFCIFDNIILYNTGYANAYKVVGSGSNMHFTDCENAPALYSDAAFSFSGCNDVTLTGIHMEGLIDTPGKAHVYVHNVQGFTMTNCSQSLSTLHNKPFLLDDSGPGYTPPLLENIFFIVSGGGPWFSVDFIQDPYNSLPYQGTIGGQTVNAPRRLTRYDGREASWYNLNYTRPSHAVLPTQPNTSLNATYLQCAGTALEQGYSTPDASAFDLTTGVDLRALVLPNTWTAATFQPLVTKYEFGKKSYELLIRSTGALNFQYTVDGSTDRGIISSATVTPTGAPLWVRCVADASGGTNVSATFYTSTDGVTWTTLGTPQTATPAGPLYSGASRVTAAQWSDAGSGAVDGFAGRFYKAEIRNLAGTLVENFDATALGVGNPQYTGTNGHVWTAGAVANVIVTQTVSADRIVAGTNGQTLSTASGVATWSSLHAEHVAAATPTGGTSGDIKVGTSKIWVNDAGTWKSVAIA